MSARIRTIIWMLTVMGALLSLQTSQAAVSRLVLDGAWEVSAADTQDWIPAQVPGFIHTDLLAAGRIPDPFYRDNESNVQWVSEKAWIYRRSFEVPADFRQHEHVLLHCDGLDTLATIRVNGTEIATTDNMFRTWEFDVKELLHAGSNSIEIQFDPVLVFVQARQEERPLPTWAYPGAAYVRKIPSNFGWDWGPTLITCGIWRSISLLAFDAARWDDVLILQDHSQSGRVGLKVRVAAGPATPAGLKARVTVRTPDGHDEPVAECPLADGTGTAELTIKSPQLWWPAGMGAQPLYTVQVELLDGTGGELDTTTKRIGLRTLETVQQTDQTTMHFVVNGVPFFAKGGNWIPADTFPNRLTKEVLRRYVADAVAANMNTLRFWGGGYYEDDALFDLCDEMGICVWLDFKFACTTYPSFDAAFLESVRHEARDNIRRLRHHPCIAVWCGNNEIMFFRGGNEWTPKKMSEGDYYKLFRDVLGSEVRALAPQSDYVTGSPDCGDVHFWEVWHGDKPFEAYRTIHGFVSEFGFQAFPAPETVRAFTAPEDRESVYSRVMMYHERSNRMYLDVQEDGKIGTDRIMNLVTMYFREPKDFESTLWLSQITQAYGIEFGAEGWRREMPKSMGCVYWQYNDTWPGTSWSSVDYFGRWKALQYRARHFYAPVLVSGTADAADGQVDLWITSDRLDASRGRLRWCVTDLAGKEHRAGTQTVDVPARKSFLLQRLELKDLVQQYGAANLLVWIALEIDGRTVSDNLIAFAKPKELDLLDPHLQTTVTGNGKEFTVTVSAAHPALWTWLGVAGADARYSDNFVHIRSGAPARIVVTLEQPMSKDAFTRALEARSLFDTYSGTTH
jgi:beta-mannosidase